MIHCHDMKVGEIYVCKDCGLELQVVKACRDAEAPEQSCSCTPCQFTCCGEELVRKEE
jgi:hypothetical protein